MMTYGFRQDPLRWARENDSLDGALVRTQVLGTARPGDRELVDEEADRLVRENERRDIGTPGGIGESAAGLARLLDLGVHSRRPESEQWAQALLDAVEELPEDERTVLGPRVIRAVWSAGAGASEAIQQSAVFGADRMLWSTTAAFGDGMGRTPDCELLDLWHLRAIPHVYRRCVDVLRWLSDGMRVNGVGLGLSLPAMNVRILGSIDHPLTDAMARCVVPLLLRCQTTDGDWGPLPPLDVYRLLKRTGLIDELAGSPPLPPDWRVTRELRVPGEQPGNIVGCDEGIWVHDRGTGKAFLVSSSDGAVLREVTLPAVSGWQDIGMWGDLLAVTDQRGKRLLAVDTHDGRVVHEVPLDYVHVVGRPCSYRGCVYVADFDVGFHHVIPMARPEHHCRVALPVSIPTAVAARGDEAWFTDWATPTMARCSLAGDLLEFAERPFRAPGQPGDSHGLVWTDDELLALDAARKRVCAIERT